MSKKFDSEEGFSGVRPLAEKIGPVAGPSSPAEFKRSDSAHPGTSMEESIAMYRKGVEFWEQALNGLVINDDDSCFWDNLETRPYLRARAGLAECLWDAGQCKESIGHYRDLLRLHPDDDQGIRYILMPRLILMNLEEEAVDLLNRFGGDDSACWLYVKALLDFRRFGDSPVSRLSLETATGKFPEPVEYILGRRTLAGAPSEDCPPGVSCEWDPNAREYLAIWDANPEAVGWLKERLG